MQDKIAELEDEVKWHAHSSVGAQAQRGGVPCLESCSRQLEAAQLEGDACKPSLVRHALNSWHLLTSIARALHNSGRSGCSSVGL